MSAFERSLLIEECDTDVPARVFRGLVYGLPDDAPVRVSFQGRVVTFTVSGVGVAPTI